VKRVIVTAEAESDGLFRSGLISEGPIWFAVFGDGLGLRGAGDDL